jgi:hypothetical protein
LSEVIARSRGSLSNVASSCGPLNSSSRERAAAGVAGSLKRFYRYIEHRIENIPDALRFNPVAGE